MKKGRKQLSLLLAAAVAAGTIAPAVSASAEEEPTVFRIATVRWTDAWPTEFLHEGIMGELEEKYNIRIEWDIYYNSDWSEQKSLLLASGDLPDAFLGSICLTSSDMEQNKENFVELTDLIAENMPNLSAIFESDTDMLALAQNTDGEIYSLVKKLPLRAATANNAYINQTWLDNLGLEAPTTYEELETVLEAFLNEDADGDGDPTNEIPYTYTGTLDYDLRNILLPFGTLVSRAGNYMGLNADGEAVFMPVEENYKEAVKWMHNLYEKGLIDAEYFTQDSSMYSAKIAAEGGSQTGLMFGWTADAEAGVNAGEFTILKSLAGPDGNCYVESDPTFLDMSDRELVITNSCENPELLLQWADEFYTDLVTLQTYYGSIPDQISDNGDGTYTLLEPEDGTSLDTSAWSYSLRDFGPKYMSDEFAANVILPATQGDGVKLADDVNAEYVTDNFPVVSYTSEQTETMNIITTDIYSYVSTQYAHWVVEGGIDEEWDSYLEQLNAMGLQELLTIQRDAYDYYLSITG